MIKIKENIDIDQEAEILKEEEIEKEDLTKENQNLQS